MSGQNELSAFGTSLFCAPCLSPAPPTHCCTVPSRTVLQTNRYHPVRPPARDPCEPAAEKETGRPPQPTTRFGNGQRSCSLRATMDSRRPSRKSASSAAASLAPTVSFAPPPSLHDHPARSPATLSTPKSHMDDIMVLRKKKEGKAAFRRRGGRPPGNNKENRLARPAMYRIARRSRRPLRAADRGVRDTRPEWGISCSSTSGKKLARTFTRAGALGLW